MSPSRSRAWAVVLATAALAFMAETAARACAPDSLILQAPLDVKARGVYDQSDRRFVVWLNWRDNPDSCSAFVHQPNLASWSVTTPPGPQLSTPRSKGPYTGDIDRTFVFRAVRDGTVGVDSVRLSVTIRREEFMSVTMVFRPSYVPGTLVAVPPLRDQRTGQFVDYGLRLSLSAGRVDAQGIFTVAAEDFEGFHIWRGTEPDGRDLVVIGEVSKEEAFKGRKRGGSLADSLYFYQVLPTLRPPSMPWFSAFGAIDCLGSRIDLPLESDQLFWYDCNATNGFTYYYAVTTFDRNYALGSGTQGLFKFDHCEVSPGLPYPCKNELVSVRMEVDAQNDLYQVYAVPNPYRSGGSRLTTSNYHNFPDRYIRFVNVPENCTVRVYTVAGDLVWETTHSSPKGNIEWDVTNRSSEPVVSGVYVYRVETPAGDSVYGRIVVIR